MENGADEFYRKWNFSACLGALDGKHINFRSLRSSGSFYYNYKENHHIVLPPVVDAFIYVDVGVNCHISNLCRAINSNKLNFLLDQTLPGQSTTEYISSSLDSGKCFWVP